MAGVRYILDVILTQTGCTKEQVFRQVELTPADLDMCNPESKAKECHFELLASFNRNLSLTASDCKPIEIQVVPDEEEDDEDENNLVDFDGNIRYLAFQAAVKWNRLNKNRPGVGFFKLTDINQAKKNETNGLSLNLTLVETYCTREEILRLKKLIPSDLEVCNLKSNAINCVFSITIRSGKKGPKLDSSLFSVDTCQKQNFKLTEIGPFKYVNQLPTDFKEVILFFFLDIIR